MCCKYLRGMSGAASAVARVIFPAEISQGNVYRNRTAKITQEKNIELKMKLIGQLTLISDDLGFLFSDSDKLNIFTSGKLSCSRPIFKTIVSISVCWNNSRRCLCFFFFRFDAAEERKEISEDWWGGNAYLKMVIYCERIKCINGVGELNVKRTKKKLNEYQPSGEGGTRSPPATPAKSKMVARGPQNGRGGLERCLPLDFLGILSTFR